MMTDVFLLPTIEQASTKHQAPTSTNSLEVLAVGCFVFRGVSYLAVADGCWRLNKNLDTSSPSTTTAAIPNSQPAPPPVTAVFFTSLIVVELSEYLPSMPPPSYSSCLIKILAVLCLSSYFVEDLLVLGFTPKVPLNCCNPHRHRRCHVRTPIRQHEKQLQVRYHDYKYSVRRGKIDDEEENIESDGDAELDDMSSSTNSKKGNVAGILEQILDPIISSPFFATFLFWLPFLGNAKLRFRASNFLSKYLDLTIAIPVTGVCFVFAVAYISYQTRLLDIELAQGTTSESLKQLRKARSAQISYSGVDDSNVKKFQMAVENYEYVLREEIELRSIAPFPSAPNDPSEREEDIAAVKTFLRMKFSDDGELVPC